MWWRKKKGSFFFRIRRGQELQHHLHNSKHGWHWGISKSFFYTAKKINKMHMWRTNNPKKTNTVTYAWTPGRRGISPQPAQTPAWTFLRQITGASHKVINLPNGFFVCLNFSSCPSSPIGPQWSPCSPTASWAHTKRIALGQWGFPQPPYPAKKKKKKNGPAAPVPVVSCWGGTGPRCQGIGYSVCSVSGGHGARDREEHKGWKRRKNWKNGTGRPSLEEEAEAGSLQRLRRRSLGGSDHLGLL